MLTIILGGSASGKSEYAENLTVESINRSDKDVKETKIYLATMQPYDEEMEKRIVKHRIQRQDKGFHTIEKYRDISEIAVPKDATILLECMSNLLANELYHEGAVGDCVGEKICADIEKLQSKCKHLIVVSNDVFHDGCVYAEETMQYLRILGEVNQKLGRQADVVVEVVCGIPLYLKS